MASEHILRIPRGDSDSDFVLVNVSSNGPSPLDLKLLATEGANPYIYTLKQSRTSKLRAKHSPLQEPQWEAVLLATLLQRRHALRDPSEIEALDKLEVIATITGDQLLLIFRKNISGITQRLGEIALTKDEDVEIDPTAWAGIAVTRATNLEHEVRDLSAKYEDQGKTIQKLSQQLEDLIEAKKRHETSLLEKFRDLLNAKKLKIRDQQRLLAGAKVDSQTAAQVHASRHPSAPYIPTASRATKRKSRAPTTAAPPSSSSVDEVEEPVKQESPASPATPEQATPEHSELDATEDEDSGDLESAPAPPARGVGAKGKVVEVAERGKGDEKAGEIASPPPRRELPFKRNEPIAEKAKAVEGAVMEEEEEEEEGDETSDDEL